MSNDIPIFRVKGSRHPVLGRDYDANTHRYTTSYLNPSKYTLIVDAFPGTKVLINGGDIQLPPGGEPQKKPQDIERLIVPPDTVAFDFSIRQRGQPFSKSISKTTALTGTFNEALPNNPWDWQVDVPGEGTYDITVKLRNQSGGGPENTRRIEVQDFLVVSIGDSAASGQGNPDVPGRPKGFEVDFDWWDVLLPPLAAYKITKAALEWGYNYLKQEFTTFARAANAKLDMDPKPVWLEKNAYRSLRSGPALAARRLENLSEGRLVTFLSFARSGSDIKAGLLGPRTNDGWIGNIGQVQEVKDTLGNRRIDALLISIGVNDIGVSGRLEEFITGDNFIFHDSDGDDDAARERVRDRIDKNLAKLPSTFDDLAKAIKTLNVRHVYLTEYPTGLFDREDGQAGPGCGLFESWFEADITPKDARLLKWSAESLNNALRKEAERHGWFFISGIAERFRGRGYCTNDSLRLFVQAEESLITQGDTEGTIHPNAAGHKIYAEQIAAAIQKNMIVWLEPVLNVMMDRWATGA